MFHQIKPHSVIQALLFQLEMPVNQRLFTGTPETGAESRKSSPLPATEGG